MSEKNTQKLSLRAQHDVPRSLSRGTRTIVTMGEELKRTHSHILFFGKPRARELRQLRRSVVAHCARLETN
jgi:hypothetical protein